MERDNIFWRVRRALGLNQVDFGRLLDRSLPSVQAYEKHGTDSFEVMQRLRTLAAENLLVVEVAEIDKMMPSLVAVLRSHLGIPIHQFAQLIDQSAEAVKEYEERKSVPADVLHRLRTLAAEKGYADIALQFSDEAWRVDRILHPGGHVAHIGKKKPGAPAQSSYRPENQRDHDLLEKILNSGDPDAIPAVQSNLYVFGKYVDAKSVATEKKKAV